MVALERILIATDGSPPAQEAVRFGLELAREQNAVVVLAHVILGYEVVPAHAIGQNGVRPRELTEADREPLEGAAAAAASSGVPATTELLIGDPADEIVAYADSIDADAIVLGRRGHGTIASAVLGSVSQGVLREARRPVVVVPRTRRREGHAAMN
jgi:nucleotide-binding universal stress UspA family protein